jgi:hypothetical protein
MNTNKYTINSNIKLYELFNFQQRKTGKSIWICPFCVQD